MDCNMNGMSGLECIKCIRKLDLNEKPYIVGLSGHDDQKIMSQFLQEGANDYRTKPISKDDLKKILF